MILNLTLKRSNLDEIQSGADLMPLRSIRKLLVFTDVPTASELVVRAKKIARLAKREGAHTAMIDVEPFFAPALTAALHQYGIQPVFSFRGCQIDPIVQKRKQIPSTVNWVCV